MSSEYSYDDEVRTYLYMCLDLTIQIANIFPKAQFFPFFILTLTGLVTVPLTYTLLRPSKDQDALAPRIQTDYKIKHAATVDSLKSAHKRKQWRVKRVLFVVAGWAIMGAMAYLIMVTKQNIPKIWNPYDILGVQEVRTGQDLHAALGGG